MRNGAALPDAAEGHELMDISIDLLSTDPALQMRSAGIDPGTVQDYAEAMADGAEFPAIIVFTDSNSYWPGDGFHRIEAAKKAGRSTINADVRQGSRRDAILLAAGANSSHGLRRTSADKRRSVVSLLSDPEWARWSDRQIGKACSVDHKTVAKIRSEMTGEIPTERTFTTRHGTVATMNTGSINGDRARGATIVERMLAAATDEALVAECERRGWAVSA